MPPLVSRGEFPSGHTADVLSLSISSTNPNMFVSGSCDSTVRLWNLRIASRAVRTSHGHNGDDNSARFFPDGLRFGRGSDDGTFRIFNMRTGHQLQVYARQPDKNDDEFPTVTSVAFSICGRLMFAGYSNGDYYVWDILVAEVVQNLGSLQNSHDARISCLGLSGDGSASCTGSYDKNLKIWAFEDNERSSKYMEPLSSEPDLNITHRPRIMATSTKFAFFVQL